MVLFEFRNISITVGSDIYDFVSLLVVIICGVAIAVARGVCATRRYGRRK